MSSIEPRFSLSCWRSVILDPISSREHRRLPRPPLQHVGYPCPRRGIEDRPDEKVHRPAGCREPCGSHRIPGREEDGTGITRENGGCTIEREGETAGVAVGADHQGIALEEDPPHLPERRSFGFPDLPPGEARLSLRGKGNGFCGNHRPETLPGARPVSPRGSDFWWGGGRASRGVLCGNRGVPGHPSPGQEPGEQVPDRPDQPRHGRSSRPGCTAVSRRARLPSPLHFPPDTRVSRRHAGCFPGSSCRWRGRCVLSGRQAGESSPSTATDRVAVTVCRSRPSRPGRRTGGASPSGSEQESPTGSAPVSGSSPSAAGKIRAPAPAGD